MINKSHHISRGRGQARGQQRCNALFGSLFYFFICSEVELGNETFVFRLKLVFFGKSGEIACCM